MDSKGFYSYIMLEFKGFAIGLVVGILLMLLLYFLSSANLIPFDMPFSTVQAAATTRR